MAKSNDIEVSTPKNAHEDTKDQLNLSKISNKQSAVDESMMGRSRFMSTNLDAIEEEDPNIRQTQGDQNKA